MAFWIYVAAFFCAMCVLAILGVMAFCVILQRGASPRKLLRRFGQKLWMTAGLGLLFGMFYLAFVFLIPYIVNEDNFLGILTYGTKHIGYLFYVAPAIIIFNAILIVALRGVIKDLYIHFRG